MAFSIFSILTFLLLWSPTTSRSRNSKTTLPLPDKYFHIYSLPVGQGDSLVIQCPAPGGELTILDMGSTDAVSGGGLWKADDLKAFLGNSFEKIKTMVITHNHDDHLNLINDVFDNEESSRNLKHLYISCRKKDISSKLKNWINKFSLTEKIRTFNGGQPCGPNNINCGNIDICPRSNLQITARVLTANWGQQCRNDDDSDGSSGTTQKPPNLKKNTDSIVIAVKVRDVQLLLNGDFEDFTSSNKEEGPIHSLVDYYGDELKSDVYHVAHHGAVNLANKKSILETVLPKAIFISSNPFSRFRHPRCLVIDRLLKLNKTICKPLASPGNRFYCGPHPIDGDKSLSTRKLNPTKLQRRYSCGEESNSELRNVTRNDRAIYSTVPDINRMNLLEFRTDGIAWGFLNNYLKKRDV